MTRAEHPAADAPAAATPAARRRFRLSVRGLMLLVAAAGLTIGYVLFVVANRDFEHAWINHQLRTLADRSADPTARAAAVEGLRGVRGRSARRAIRLLAAALEEPDARLRAEAAEAIARLGVPLIDESGPAATATVRPAFPALLDAIGDRDPDVAVAAIGAADALLAAGDRNGAGTIDPEALRSRLRPLVRDPGGGAPAAARARALRLLKELGAVEDKAAVLAALDDPEPAVRLEAIGLLDRAIPAVSAPPASLLRAIGDDDPEVRAAAHWTLVRWGRGPRWVMQPRWPAARPAVVAALDRRIDRTDGDERRVLIAILSAYDPAAAVADYLPEMAEALNDDDADRHGPLLYFEQLGPAARPALPALGDAAVRAIDARHLFDGERLVLLVAALGPETPEAAEVLDRLIDALSDPPAGHEGDISLVERLILDFGPAARAALPRLREFARRPGHTEVVDRLIEAIGPGPAP